MSTRCRKWQAVHPSSATPMLEVVTMAIFHLSVKVVSRGGGQSAVAKAAYNSRTKLEDERTGLKKDYSRGAEAVVFSGIFAPKNAPQWASDRQQLWNEVERKEDASNRAASAQLAREVVIALPHELSPQQREWLVKDFVREQFTRKGMVADVNIHAPREGDDPRNHHAHILATMREVGPEGFGPKVREWNSRKQVEQWRESWENIVNKQLERHGHAARIDRRTLEAQGIDREPTTHLGPFAQAMERKNQETERGNTYREAVHRIDDLAALKSELADVDKAIAEHKNDENAIFFAAQPNSPEVAEKIGLVAAEVFETTPTQVAGVVSGFAEGLNDGLKVLGGIAALFGGNQPPPPQSKEEAEARKRTKLANAERMLHDREYRKRIQEEPQKQRREDDRQREQDDEDERRRQRY
ncbi:MAG TPA: MobQ family relaxase [Candidatus Angelobacter sp.]|jgi:hypothetical protein|nr:MobQ family relaxase [Candidatus Angelobacter sp.]